MNNFASILKNEEGSAIVFALLALAVLTIVGVSSSGISNTELIIVKNELIYQTNFYQAESSANEGAYYIESETNGFELLPDSSGYSWMNDGNADNPVDLTVSGSWVITGDAATDNAGTSQVKNITNSTYSALANGPRDGSPLDIGSSRLYEFAVFGKSEEYNGSAVVEIGYLKRF